MNWTWGAWNIHCQKKTFNFIVQKKFKCEKNIGIKLRCNETLRSDEKPIKRCKKPFADALIKKLINLVDSKSAYAYQWAHGREGFSLTFSSCSLFLCRVWNNEFMRSVQSLFNLFQSKRNRLSVDFVTRARTFSQQTPLATSLDF